MDWVAAGSQLWFAFLKLVVFPLAMAIFLIAQVRTQWETGKYSSTSPFFKTRRMGGFGTLIKQPLMLMLEDLFSGIMTLVRMDYNTSASMDALNRFKPCTDHDHESCRGAFMLHRATLCNMHAMDPSRIKQSHAICPSQTIQSRRWKELYSRARLGTMRRIPGVSAVIALRISLS